MIKLLLAGMLLLGSCNTKYVEYNENDCIVVYSNTRAQKFVIHDKFKDRYVLSTIAYIIDHSIVHNEENLVFTAEELTDRSKKINCEEEI